MELGSQHEGVAGFPAVVAPTLVYMMELQEPTPTVRGSAVKHESFVGGCA